MDFIPLSEGRKATLWDRLANAYYAFHMKLKPDIQAVIDEIERMQKKDNEEHTALEEKRAAALEKLQPFEQSQVHSIASMSESWREQFDQVMLFIDQLPIADQITLIQYIFEGNRRIVTTLRFRQWMSNHAEAILDNLHE